jgi:ubiquinone biosynthesis protein COQ4
MENSLSHFQYLKTLIRGGNKTMLLLSVHNLMGCFSFRRLYRRMLLNPDGQYILKNRPVVSPQTVNIDKLLLLPPDSFGFLFAQHMVTHGFDKGVVSPPKSPFENENTAYAKQRWRETHDFRHVLTGLQARMSDEAIIAAFQFGNHSNSWSLLVCLLGPLFSFRPLTPIQQWSRMYEAYCTGKKAVCLASVNYEAEFSTPVEILRKKWNIKCLSHLGYQE